MIPVIGIMVAFYIITRMLEIFEKKEKGKATNIFAVLTALVALYAIFALATSASNIASSLTQ